MTEEFIIKYTKRKSMRLSFTQDASIEVRAPLGTSRKVIDDFVKSHQAWIEEHYASVKKQVDSRDGFHLNFEDQLIFFGKTYGLVPIDEKKSGFNGECFYAHRTLGPQELKNEVVTTYRDLAQQVLAQQVETICQHMKLKPQSVKINGAKSRWGSCSSKGRLNFSWYLVMADEATVNYVVVHELAHLLEMNHSPKFWKIVEQILPNYQQEKKKLKELQKILITQKWE